MKRKFKLLCACAMCAGMCILMSACGSRPDISGYLEAMLDLSYKGEASAYVEMGLGTQEEAQALYEKGISDELDSLCEKMSLSDEQKERFGLLIKQLYEKADYTVGNAAKQDDGSYTVQIAYRKMIVFEPTMNMYYESIEELPDKWESMSETPSQEEMLSDMADALYEAMSESIENAQYGDEETFTFKIELVDNYYMPDSEDSTAFELALFDADYSTEQDSGE